MLRVYEIQELFDAAETLTRSRPAAGDRLLIVTNGRGPGAVAADAQIAGGGRLAELSAELRRRLDEVLPATWSGANPIDITCDAPGDRYADALEILLAESEADGILVLHSPTAIASSEDAARAVAETVAAVAPHRIVLTSWLGGEGAEPARRILRDAAIATYDAPGDAVRAFLHMVAYRRNQRQLMETPPSLPRDFDTDVAAARAVIERALAAGREVLERAGIQGGPLRLRDRQRGDEDRGRPRGGGGDGRRARPSGRPQDPLTAGGPQDGCRRRGPGSGDAGAQCARRPTP